jgi:hypothetical protein
MCSRVCAWLSPYNLCRSPCMPCPALTLVLMSWPLLVSCSIGSAARAIDMLFERAVSGFLANPSLQLPHLLIVCHSWMTQTVGTKTMVQPSKAQNVVAEMASRSWVVRGDADPHGANKTVVTARPTTTFIIAPEPKLTGEDRHAAQRAKARRLQGTDSIMWFAASLFHGCLRKRLIDCKSDLHLRMIDPFVSQLLNILQRTKVDRILTTCLRISSILFTFPLPSLKHTAKGFARSVLSLVHGNTAARVSAGRSELSECALRAVTSLLRSCQHVKVCCTYYCLVRTRFGAAPCLHGLRHVVHLWLCLFVTAVSG